MSRWQPDYSTACVARSAPILLHLLLGHQGLLVRIHSIIVTHIIITHMRPFYNRLPVRSRSHLRSYNSPKFGIDSTNPAHNHALKSKEKKEGMRSHVVI